MTRNFIDDVLFNNRYVRSSSRVKIMRWNKKTVLWLWCLVLLCVIPGLTMAEMLPVISVPTIQSLATIQVKTGNETLHSTHDASTFSLITLESADQLKILAMTEKQSLPTQVGFSRNIDMLLTPHETSRQLSWQSLPDSGRRHAMCMIFPL